MPCSCIFLQIKVTEFSRTCNIGQCGPVLENQLIKGIRVLTSLDDDYRLLVDQGNYQPAKQIKAAEHGMTASQVKRVDRLEQAMIAHGKLEQTRDATSTKGNDVKPGNKNRNGKRRCYRCGDENHILPDCPKPANADDSLPYRPGSGALSDPPAHGLSYAESCRINALSRAECPDLLKATDGQEIKENNKAIATFCARCGHFTKGATMHSGTTHGKSDTKSDKTDGDSKPAAFVGIVVPTEPPTEPPAVSAAPMTETADPPMTRATYQPASIPNYDFGGMAVHNPFGPISPTDSDDSEDSDDSDAALTATLNSKLSLKG